MRANTTTMGSYARKATFMAENDPAQSNVAPSRLIDAAMS
jgi:hypothetical protein